MEALGKFGCESKRQRDLPAELAVYLVLALGLYRSCSTPEILRLVVDGLRHAGREDGTRIPGRAAVSFARERVGVEPLEELRRRQVRPLAQPGDPGCWFGGLRLMAIDSGTLDMPDEQANREAFGPADSPPGEKALPQCRVMMLVEMGSRAPLAWNRGRPDEAAAQAEALLPHMSADMLVLADRRHSGIPLWRLAARTGARLLWEVGPGVPISVEEEHPDGSCRCAAGGNGGGNGKGRGPVPARVIEYRPEKGDSTCRLMTNIPPDDASAAELAGLYQARWAEAEAYGATKDLLFAPGPGYGAALRSKTPELVRQEVEGFMLAHYAVRTVMHEGARGYNGDSARQPPKRSVHVIRGGRQASPPSPPGAPGPKAKRRPGTSDAPENPFRPGEGAPPPVRVGHSRPLSFLRVALKGYLGSGARDAVVLSGPRGAGKTALLAELRSSARDTDAVVRTIRGGPMLRPLGAAVGYLLERSSFAATGHDYSADDEFRMEGGEGPYVGGEMELQDALLVGLSERPMLLCVDDANAMCPEFGLGLLETARECIDRKLPLVMVLAGTPRLPGDLLSMGAGFTSDWRHFRVGRLESDNMVRRALSLPAEKAGRPFDKDALGLLAEESLRYPLFVQMLGHCAWEAAEEAGGGRGRITLEDARRGIERADGLRHDFYAACREELIAQGVLAEAEAVSRAVTRLGAGKRMGQRALDRALEGAPPRSDLSTWGVLERLMHVGLVRQAPGDRWEQGIPGLCKRIAEQAS